MEFTRHYTALLTLLLSLSITRLPIEHPMSDLLPPQEGPSIIIRRTDPFIYNPRLKSGTVSQVRNP